MRIRVSEEEDFQNQAFLWEANLERSLKGRKGQAALRELEAALLALPDKRLIANETVSTDGAVCAIAALARHRGYQGDMALPKRPNWDDDNDDDSPYWDEFEYEEAVESAMLNIATDLGVPPMVAKAIIYKNDDDYVKTPEARYQKMLRWTQRYIQRENDRGITTEESHGAVGSIT